MVGEIAGKQFPKAICSSYFQANTQTFMLAVIAAFLKSALLTPVLVWIEIEKAGSRGRGVVTFICGQAVFHHHSLPFLLQPFPQTLPLSCSKPWYQHQPIQMKTKVGDLNNTEMSGNHLPFTRAKPTSATSKASLEALRREFSVHCRRGQQCSPPSAPLC